MSLVQKFRLRAAHVDACRLPAENEDISEPDKAKLHALLDGVDWESGYDGCLVLHYPDASVEANPGDWIVRIGENVITLDDAQFARMFTQAP